MKPFSVMMGALQVGEKLSFSYDVKARRAGSLSAARRRPRRYVRSRSRTPRAVGAGLPVLASDLL